jgi:cell division protein FtsW
VTLILEHRPEISRFALGRWWRALDKWLLAAVMFLFCTGLVLAYSTSPILALPRNQDAFYFATRQLVFAVPAGLLFLGFSMGTPREIRRAGVLLFALVVALLLIVLLVGEERNGSKRWLSFVFFSVQPSELIKPALIAMSAWMFSLRPGTGVPPGALIAAGCLALVALLVGMQPDYSQTALICAVWGAMFFMTGASVVWAVSAGLIGAAGIGVAFAVSPYVADRIRLLFDAEATGGGGQIRRMLDAIHNGGFWGVGPGEGTAKFRVPDAHSDFVIAVVAEEYGFALTLLIILAFALITLRGFLIATRLKSLFARYAVCGLSALIGFQAFIHIGVAARILPPTGMTLPLISYGGSSLMAMGIACGMLMGLTRSDMERVPEGRS